MLSGFEMDEVSEMERRLRVEEAIESTIKKFGGGEVERSYVEFLGKELDGEIGRGLEAEVLEKGSRRGKARGLGEEEGDLEASLGKGMGAVEGVNFQGAFPREFFGIRVEQTHIKRGILS